MVKISKITLKITYQLIIFILPLLSLIKYSLSIPISTRVHFLNQLSTPDSTINDSSELFFSSDSKEENNQSTDITQSSHMISLSNSNIKEENSNDISDTNKKSNQTEIISHSNELIDTSQEIATNSNTNNINEPNSDSELNTKETFTENSSEFVYDSSIIDNQQNKESSEIISYSSSYSNIKTSQIDNFSTNFPNEQKKLTSKIESTNIN